MALENADLLAVCRPAAGTYKITVADFKSAAGTLPPGVEVNDILIWNGAEWARADRLDHGVIQLGAGEVDYLE